MSPIAPGAAPSHVMRSRPVARPPVLLLSPRRGWHCLSAVPPTAHPLTCLLLFIVVVVYCCSLLRAGEAARRQGAHHGHVCSLQATPGGAQRPLTELQRRHSTAEVTAPGVSLFVCMCTSMCMRVCVDKPHKYMCWSLCRPRLLTLCRLRRREL